MALDVVSTSPDANPAPFADTQPGSIQTDANAAPATGAEAPVEETAEQIAEREALNARKRHERAQRRINERFRELTGLVKEKDDLIRQLALRQQPQQQQAPKDEPPRRDQYDSYEEWMRDDARYHAIKAVQQVTAQDRQHAQNAQRQIIGELQRAATMQTFGNRIEAYAKDHPDFAEVFESDLDVTAFQDAIVEMDDAPAIMVALHRNPEIAERLRRSSAHMQGVILGQLSAALKRPPQVSKAPPPGNPVGGKSAAAEVPLADLPYDEYVKARRAGRKV